MVASGVRGVDPRRADAEHRRPARRAGLPRGPAGAARRASRYVVVLDRRSGLAPGAPERPATRRTSPRCWGTRQPITAGVPSTTATSLASLGTGLPPGQHGMVGYTSRVPATGEILNALTWESDLVARAYQPKPTFFERAAPPGSRSARSRLERFQRSGLTEAGLRGAGLRRPFEHERDEEQRIELSVAAARARRAEPGVRLRARARPLRPRVGLRVDRAGWTHLTRIDAMCERLRTRCPTTCCSDHHR